MTGRDGIARALYVAVVGKRVVVLRAFVKKTQKTPHSEIELALKRAKELLSRFHSKRSRSGCLPIRR